MTTDPQNDQQEHAPQEEEVALWRFRALVQRAVIEDLKKWLPFAVTLIAQDGWYIGIVEDGEATPH